MGVSLDSFRSSHFPYPKPLEVTLSSENFPMTEIAEEFRLRLLDRPPLDYSCRPVSVQVRTRNFWDLGSGIFLAAFGLLKLGASALGGMHSSWDLLLGLGCLCASMTFLKQPIMKYDISLGPTTVSFSRTSWAFPTIQWQVPLSQYQTVGLRSFSMPYSSLLGFSVDLIHSDPKKCLPLETTTKRSTAEKQLEILHQELKIPLMAQANATLDSHGAVPSAPASWTTWPIYPTFSLTQGLLLGGLGLFFLATQNISSLEGKLFFGALTLLVIRAILLLFVALFVRGLEQGQQFPFGLDSRWSIDYRNLTETPLTKRVQKWFQRERQQLQEFGFYDLCCIRLVLPPYSALLNPGLYGGLRILDHYLQIQTPWRLSILHLVLAFPGEATYAIKNGLGMTFTSAFDDGTLLRTSTRNKIGALNFVNTEERIYSFSTGLDIKETWQFHQAKKAGLLGEGKTLIQDASFEEFVTIDRRITEWTNQHDWYLIE